MATYSNLNLARLAAGANSALESFVKTLLPLNLFSRRYDPETATRARGNVVLVPLIGTLTATTFNGTYAISGGSMSVVTVTIDRHKIVPIGQRDLDAMNNSDGDLEMLMNQAGAALATLQLEDIFTAVNTTNFGLATAVAAAALDVPQLRKARLALNLQNAPQSPRNAILDSISMDALLGITNFVQAQMFRDTGVLTEGRVTRALGFDFYEYVAPFTISSMGFFAHPSALAVGMRYVQPQVPGAYEMAQAFSDPNTGATIGLRSMYDPLTGQRYIALEANYGFSVGISYAGTIIKRTD